MTPHPEGHVTCVLTGDRGGHPDQSAFNPNMQPGGGRGGGTPPNCSVHTSHTACRIGRGGNLQTKSATKGHPPSSIHSQRTA